MIIPSRYSILCLPSLILSSLLVFCSSWRGKAPRSNPPPPSPSRRCVSIGSRGRSPNPIQCLPRLAPEDISADHQLIGCKLCNSAGKTNGKILTAIAAKENPMAFSKWEFSSVFIWRVFIYCGLMGLFGCGFLVLAGCCLLLLCHADVWHVMEEQ